MAGSEIRKRKLIEKSSLTWTLHAFNQVKKKFSVGEKELSSIFPDDPNCQYQWQLELYPKGMSNSDTSIALNLCLLKPTKEKVFVKFALRLEDSFERIIIKASRIFCFSEEDNCWALKSFCEKSILESRAKDDFVKIVATVKIDLTRNGEIEIYHGKRARSEDKLSDDLELLLNNKKFSDFVIKVNEREFPVHRCILAARSPVFAAMFEHDTSENKEGHMDVTDIDYVTMKYLINFIYKGYITLEGLKIDKAQKLWHAADKYAFDNLKTVCEKQIIDYVSGESVLDILLWANTHSVKDLKTKSILYICENLDLFSDGEMFKELSQQAPELLLEMMVKMSEFKSLNKNSRFKTINNVFTY